MLRQAVEALAPAEGSAVRAVAIDADQSTVEFIVPQCKRSVCANLRLSEGVRVRASMRAEEAKATFIEILEEKMMQTTVRYSAVAAIMPAWLMSVAILISVADFNVAQAQTNKKTEQSR